MNFKRIFILYIILNLFLKKIWSEVFNVIWYLEISKKIFFLNPEKISDLNFDCVMLAGDFLINIKPKKRFLYKSIDFGNHNNYSDHSLT